LENEVVKEGQLRKKRERETLARWRKLTKGVLIREKLKEKYGVSFNSFLFHSFFLSNLFFFFFFFQKN